MCPIYEYLCVNGHRHERLEPMTGGECDAAFWNNEGGYWRSARLCPECGGEAFRQVSAANIAPDGAYSHKQGKREGAA